MTGTDVVERIENKIDKTLTGQMVVSERGITFTNASEVLEYAKLMATSRSAVPEFCRGSPGDCLAIIDDAIRFGFSPYALARKAYFVNQRVAYEAQAIAAIIIKWAPLDPKRPEITYEGEGQERRCMIRGTEAETGRVLPYDSPRVKDINPKNSPLWKSDVDQQLAYYSLRAFARRWFPEILLGLFDVEELGGKEDGSNMTISPPARGPATSGLAARLPGAQSQSGFAKDAVARGTGIPEAEVIEARPTQAAASPGGAAGSSAGGTETAKPSTAEDQPNGSITEETADERAGEPDAGEDGRSAPERGSDVSTAGVAESGGEHVDDGTERAAEAGGDVRATEPAGDAGLDREGVGESGAAGVDLFAAARDSSLPANAEAGSTTANAGPEGEGTAGSPAPPSPNAASFRMFWEYADHLKKAAGYSKRLGDLKKAAQEFWDSHERPAKGSEEIASIEKVYSLIQRAFVGEITMEDALIAIEMNIGPHP